MSELLLTDRWFTIPEHVQKLEVQNRLRDAFLKKEALNFCIAAGRRSFKTERFIKRAAVYEVTHTKGKSFVIGAPTRQQAKDIIWEDIKALSHPIFVKRISETELKIYYRNGSSLQVIGLKEFRRKQGSLIHGAFATEYQDCDPEVYTHTFQPMLNDTGGFWIIEGRPLGKNHLYDAYIKGQEKKDGWLSFHWTSEVVLSDEQILRAKAEITDLDYRREYLADFETLGARPYYSYSDKNHAIKPYNIKKPLIFACDFNPSTKPMSWTIGFEEIIGIEEVTFWIKTFALQFTNTKAMCEHIDNWLIKKYGVIPQEMHFYGDYAGNSPTSNSSLTDWQIIEDYWRNKSKIKLFLKPCLSVRNSIGATNARLKNALNQYRMFIDPVECDPLKQDWIRVGWKENGVQLEDKDPMRTHAGRGVDYYSDYKYPNYNIGGTKII